LDARPHEVALLKVKNLKLGPRYAEGEIPHESKTGTGPIMLTSSFPYVRDWLNEHPFRNEPNSRVICNLVTGGSVTAETISSIMKQLQKRIVRLVESGEITDNEEREKLEFLLKTKRWTPYCIRHSAITHDSDYLPEFALRKKVRWSMNSRQPSRYIKTRLGNDLRQKILAQNGIITTDEAKPTPTVAECARCKLVNALENKYCSSCGYPLSVKAYEVLKAEEVKEIDVLKSQISKLSADLKDTNFILRYSIAQELIGGMDKKPIELTDAEYTEFQTSVRKLMDPNWSESEMEGEGADTKTK
jgi:hypothetical protein